MKAAREDIFKKFNGKCAYCGKFINFKEMQVDHIIPKSTFDMHIKNGFKIPQFLQHLTINDKNHLDNLFPSCRVCNKWKAAHHLELFRNELAEQVNRLNRYNSNYRIAKMFNQVKETESKIVFYFEINNQHLESQSKQDKG